MEIKLLNTTVGLLLAITKIKLNNEIPQHKQREDKNKFLSKWLPYLFAEKNTI